MKKLVLFVVALLFVAARSASGREGHKAAQDHMLPEIKAIYFILGCLDEYMGRAIIEKGADDVERFYSSEVQASQVFEKYLKLLVAEESINTTIRKEISEGGHISFHSPELYERINSMYPHSFFNSPTMVRPRNKPDGPYVSLVHAFVSMNLFKGQDKTAKLSFLAGAYARYGHQIGDNKFEFRTANAWHKINLIGELLKELGCSNVAHETSDRRAKPVSHTLKFTASPEIKKLFDSVSKEKNGRDQVRRSVVK